MTQGVLLHRAIGHTFVAIANGASIDSILAVPAHVPGAVGNIYRGRVVRLVEGMQAAFVDIGLERTALLHAEDVAPIVPLPSGPEGAQRTPEVPRIRSLLQLHQHIIVQIRKEASGDKGARITARIALRGHFLLALPGAAHVAISQRIDSGEERSRLQSILAPVMQTQKTGFVVRTAAQGQDATSLLAEAEQLQKRWQTVVQANAVGQRPTLLWADADAVCARLLTVWRPQMQRLWCDDAQLAALARASLAEHVPSEQLPTVFPIDAFAGGKGRTVLGKSLQKALAQKVYLPGGGYLLIEHTAAMCVIDVNSGSMTEAGGKAAKTLQSTMLTLNLEAAREVARQIRLRNIGGIVVVDFVDVGGPDNADSRAQIQACLQEGFAGDGVKTFVSRMSELGLIQMTRRRSHAALHEQMRSACLCCAGKGHVPAAWHVATAAIWAIEKSLAYKQVPMLLLHASEAVCAVLLAPQEPALPQLMQRFGCSIVAVARARMPADTFEVLPLGDEAGTVQRRQL